MPTLRRRAPRLTRNRINHVAVTAFKAKDADALYQAMDLKPWHVNPLEVDDGPSPWPPGTAGHRSWPVAQEQRKQLEALAKETDEQ